MFKSYYEQIILLRGGRTFYGDRFGITKLFQRISFLLSRLLGAKYSPLMIRHATQRFQLITVSFVKVWKNQSNFASSLPVD